MTASVTMARASELHAIPGMTLRRAPKPQLTGAQFTGEIRRTGAGSRGARQEAMRSELDGNRGRRSCLPMDAGERLDGLSSRAAGLHVAVRG